MVQRKARDDEFQRPGRVLQTRKKRPNKAKFMRARRTATHAALPKSTKRGRHR